MKESYVCPYIKTIYTLIPHSPNAVELRWGAWNTTSFTIEIGELSVPLINILREMDGKNSCATIAAKCNMQLQSLNEVVDTLAELGVLQEGPSEIAAEYFENFASRMQALVAPQISANVFRTTKISLIADSTCNLTTIQSSLAQFSIDIEVIQLATIQALVTESQWQADGLEFERLALKVNALLGCSSILFHSNRFEPNLLLCINRILFFSGKSVIYSFIDGPFIFVGPTVIPSQSGCFECLERRVFSNLRSADSYLKFKGRGQIAGNYNVPIIPEFLQQLGLNIAAMEVMHLLRAERNFTRNKILSLYLPTFEFSFHEVLPVSSCATCGSDRYRDDTELYFSSRDLWKSV